MKEEKNEELQSRREFFKKAAKAALPVVGAVVLSSLPVAQAKATPYGCQDSCLGSCWAACQSTCRSYCQTGCTGTCEGGCQKLSY